MLTRARILLIIATLAFVAATGAALFVYFGVYNIAATEQHTAPVYQLLEFAMRQSVRRRADDIIVPPLSDPALVRRGLGLYHANCLPCHGAPGIAPEGVGLGLLPVPVNLVATGREWPPAEIYWVIKHGIKMSGMPAWQHRFNEADLWALTAFIETLPHISPLQYAAMAKETRAIDVAELSPPATPLRVADAERGKATLQQYACVACHQIPGVVGANTPVGPPLKGIATRKYLAGFLPNTPGNMLRWLMHPQEVQPTTAMPDLRLSEGDARDIAAYLATLR